MNRYKVAIIGCGRVSEKHLKAYSKLKDRIELVCVADTNTEGAKKLLAERGFVGVKIYSDYEEMLNTEKVDICAITVPSGLHYKIATFCLNKGLHILLEKPMTMSSSESKELYELSKKVDKKIAMGHIYRYFPIVGILRDDLASGSFGKITHGTICVRWGHGQDYYDSAAWRGTWKSDGGALMNQSIHAIDLLLWLMGSKAVSVNAKLARRLRNIEAEDVGMAVMELESGALAMLEGTTATLPSDKEAMFSIFCEKGAVSLGLKRGKPSLNIRNEKGHSMNFKYIRKQLSKGGFKSFSYALNPHTGIYADLINAIDNNTQPIADAYAGFTSVDTLMGIYRSAKEGCSVALPLDSDFASTDMQNFFEKV